MKRHRYIKPLLFSMLLTALTVLATVPLKWTLLNSVYEWANGNYAQLWFMWFIGYWSLVATRNASREINPSNRTSLRLFAPCLVPLATGIFLFIWDASTTGNQFYMAIQEAEAATPVNLAGIKGILCNHALGMSYASMAGIIGLSFCTLSLLLALRTMHQNGGEPKGNKRTWWIWVLSLCVALSPYAILSLNPDLKMGFQTASSWSYDAYLGRFLYYLNDRTCFFILMLLSGALNIAEMARLAIRSTLDSENRRIYAIRSAGPLLLGLTATLIGYRRSWEYLAMLLGSTWHGTLHEAQAITQKLFGLANQALLIGLLLWAVCFWMAWLIPNATRKKTSD